MADDLFSFVRGDVMDGLKNITNNASKMGDTQDRVQQYTKQVMSSWIGGDEKAFEQEVQTELIPAIADFIAALAGLNTNSLKAIDIMDQADSASKGLVSSLQDVFNNI